MKNLKDTLTEAILKESFGKDIQMPRTKHCIIFTDRLFGSIGVYGFNDVEELSQITDTQIEDWHDLEDHLKAGEICYADSRGNFSWNKQISHDSLTVVIW